MSAEKKQYGIPDRIGEGGAFLNPSGGEGLDLANMLRGISRRNGGASLAALKGIGKRQGDRFDGMLVTLADGSRWRWKATCTATGDDLLVVTPTDAPAAGRWVRAVGPAVILMPISFATLDAANLLTLPAGAVLAPEDFFWDVATSFAGGAASAVGLSSSTLAGHTTKGDLLGGATGDVAAGLTSAIGWTPGTVGTVWATLANRRVFLKGADTLRFDRITSVFTSGAGYAGVRGVLLQEPT